MHTESTQCWHPTLSVLWVVEVPTPPGPPAPNDQAEVAVAFPLAAPGRQRSFLRSGASIDLCYGPLLIQATENYLGRPIPKSAAAQAFWKPTEHLRLRQQARVDRRPFMHLA